MTDSARDAAAWDFFVSYTQADRAWAEWIAWVLEEDGYQVLIQAWDMVAGSNWIGRMDHGVRSATRMVAVLSPDYPLSVYCGAEWQAAWAKDPQGQQRQLITVCVRGERPQGLLAGVVGIDLVGMPESAARRRLREEIAAAVRGRAKPSSPPPFPRVVPTEPRFPGALPEVSIRASRWRRRAVLDAVREALAIGEGLVVLQGLPRSGKTTAMWDAVDEVADGGEVHVVDAGSIAHTEINRIVELIGRSVGVPARDSSSGDRVWRDVLTEILAGWSDGRLLVVLDDLDPSTETAELATLLASAPNTAVLATSRTQPPEEMGARLVVVAPLSEQECRALVEHEVAVLGLAIDPERVIRALPPGPLSLPGVLRAFLVQASRTPVQLLAQGPLPDAVLVELLAVSDLVAALSAGNRASLAYLDAVGGARLSDLLAAGLIKQADIAAALDQLVTQSLVRLREDGVEVPAVVSDVLARVDPDCRRVAGTAVVEAVRLATGNARTVVGAALAAALPLIAKRWLNKGEVSLLRELISHELLDRLNQQGHWREYAALTRLLITAMDQQGDVAGSVGSRCRLARKVAQVGDLGGGWSLLREARQVLSENGPAVLHAEVHSHRAFLAHLQGDQLFALKELRLCIELRTALADHTGLFLAHKLEGNILLQRGEHRAAAASFNAALALDILEGSTQRLEAETSLAVCEMRLSREDQARERLERVIWQMRATGVDTELARALFTRALLAELQGMPAQALDLVRQAADLPARDPAVRMAINRMVWRLERFPPDAAQG